MKMKTIVEHQGDDEVKDEEEKKLSLKARGLSLVKRLNCCSGS